MTAVTEAVRRARPDQGRHPPVQSRLLPRPVHRPAPARRGLHVTHDFRDALVGAGHDYPIVAHPIVRTHRETGKKILFVNFTEHPRIVGLDGDESRTGRSPPRESSLWRDKRARNKT